MDFEDEEEEDECLVEIYQEQVRADHQLAKAVALDSNVVAAVFSAVFDWLQS